MCGLTVTLSLWNNIHKLHEGEVDVPKQTQYSHVQWLHFGWHEGEIDHLEQWPHLVVGLQCRDHLVRQLIVAIIQTHALEERETGIECAYGDEREESLGKQPLLGDGRGTLFARGDPWKNVAVRHVQHGSMHQDTVACETGESVVVDALLVGEEF